MRLLRGCSYLFGAENSGHHTLWFCSLCALVDQDGSELHLSQARISCPDTGAADHICILTRQQRRGILKTSYRRSIVLSRLHNFNAGTKESYSRLEIRPSYTDKLGSTYHQQLPLSSASQSSVSLLIR